MSHEWSLTDSDSHAYTETMEIGPSDVPGIDGKTKFSIHKKRLGGGLSDGVDVVVVNNEAMSCTVLPTRGMGLWKAKVGDMVIGWDSPVQGPVHPKYVNLFEDSGLGWLDGFDELMCRCGLESNGGPVNDEQGRLLYALHGRIANTPAKKVTAFFDADQQEVGVTGVVDETRLFHNKLQLTSTVSMPVRRTSEGINAVAQSVRQMYAVSLANTRIPASFPNTCDGLMRGLKQPISRFPRGVSHAHCDITGSF